MYVPATGGQLGLSKPLGMNPDATISPIVSGSQNTSTNKKIGETVVIANQPSSFVTTDTAKVDTASKKDVSAQDGTSVTNNWCDVLPSINICLQII